MALIVRPVYFSLYIFLRSTCNLSYNLLEASRPYLTNVTPHLIPELCFHLPSCGPTYLYCFSHTKLPVLPPQNQTDLLAKQIFHFLLLAQNWFELLWIRLHQSVHKVCPFQARGSGQPSATCDFTGLCQLRAPVCKHRDLQLQPRTHTHTRCPPRVPVRQYKARHIIWSCSTWGLKGRGNTLVLRCTWPRRRCSPSIISSNKVATLLGLYTWAACKRILAELATESPESSFKVPAAVMLQFSALEQQARRC